MAASPFEHAAEASAALRAIVSDPTHGVDALSSPQTMANLLRDFLPDAPRETGLLIAAASARLPAMLRGHVAQGMDARTASSLAAASFASVTAFTPEACRWVAAELATALGLADNRVYLGEETLSRAAPAPDPPPAISRPATPTFTRSETDALADGLAQGSAPQRHRRSAALAIGLLAAVLAVIGSFALGYNTGSHHAVIRTHIVTRTRVVHKTVKVASSVPCWVWNGVPYPSPISTQTGVVQARCTIRIGQPAVAASGAYAILTDPAGQSANYVLMRTRI